MSGFNGPDNFVEVKLGPSGKWTNIMTAATDPGVASSTVAVFPNTLSIPTGSVGIGTTTPLAKLQVNGQAASVTASVSNLNVDFNSGNIQSNSVAAGTLVLNNMVDGASYTLVLTNATGGNYVLSGSGVASWRCTPSCSSNTVTAAAGYHTVMSLFKIGTVGYVSWISL